MPVEDVYSDSDEENHNTENETSVVLGVPDGSIDSPYDMTDPEVSRIGGQPAFLTSERPSTSSSCCATCSDRMELLVQLWCPFENSPMDRCLYVFGCAKSGCQRRDGSVRAWRALRYNKKYAKTLLKKKEKERLKQEKERAEALRKAVEVAGNPFSISTGGSKMSSGLGTQLFGANPFGSSPSAEDSRTDSDGEETPSDDDSPSKEQLASREGVTQLGAALESTTISESPCYAPIYLSINHEYIPTTKPNPEIPIPDGDGKDAKWGPEGYENSLEVDEVFSRFSNRVALENEQCVRYDLNGLPLPFQSDSVYKQLFPIPVPSNPTPTTKPVFAVQPLSQRRVYNPSSVAACPFCNGPRTFECQLMPNVLNVLRHSDRGNVKKTQTEQERLKELERVLGKKAGSESGTGMEWGTCMIFSCEKNCCVRSDGSELEECWREELVLVQWE